MYVKSPPRLRRRFGFLGVVYALRRDVSSLVIHSKSFGNIHDCVQESGNGCQWCQCRVTPENKNSFLLSGVEERYIEPRTIQYRFKSILKSCNLKDIKFHALRHTFATRCIEGGCDIKCLSEMLGHSSVSITLNRYVHSSIEQKKSNITKMLSILNFKPSLI